MTSRTISLSRDKDEACKWIQAMKPPFTLSIVKGKKRSEEQNKLQRMWHMEAAAQLQDETAEQKRGYCKLHFGIPILRDEDDEFRERYDAVFKGLPYETKLALMQEPFDFPVTRLMKVGQKARYLNDVQNHYKNLGVRLTNPDD